MKKIIFTILIVAIVCFGACCIATAQEPEAPVAQSDQITADGQQIIQDDDTSTGTFEPVTVDSFTTSDVALQFPASFTNRAVVIEAPDGGTLSTNSATIDTNGNLSFSFQVADQPGVHRVMVIDPNADEDSPHIVGVVQFEVPEPAL